MPSNPKNNGELTPFQEGILVGSILILLLIVVISSTSNNITQNANQNGIGTTTLNTSNQSNNLHVHQTPLPDQYIIVNESIANIPDAVVVFNITNNLNVFSSYCIINNAYLIFPDGSTFQLNKTYVSHLLEQSVLNPESPCSSGIIRISQNYT